MHFVGSDDDYQHLLLVLPDFTIYVVKSLDIFHVILIETMHTLKTNLIRKRKENLNIAKLQG